MSTAPIPNASQAGVHSSHFRLLHCDERKHLPEVRLHQYFPPRSSSLMLFPDHPQIIRRRCPIWPCSNPAFLAPKIPTAWIRPFSGINEHYIQIKIYDFISFSKDAAEVIEKHKFFMLVCLGYRGEWSLCILM
jgi:hypothetical protein